MSATRALGRPLLLLVALAALLGPNAGRAADEAASGFEWRGRLYHLGRALGRFELDATRLAGDAGAAWRVADRLVPEADGVDEIRAEARLGADLLAVDGEYLRRNEAGRLAGRYRSDEDGRLRLEHQTQDYDNLLHPTGPWPATTTLAGWLLVLRERGLDKPWSFPDFDPDPAPGDPYLAPAHVEPQGLLAWTRSDGLVRRLATVAVTRGQRTYRLALEEDGGLVALEVVGLSLAASVGDVGPWRPSAGAAAPPTRRERAASDAALARSRLPFATQPWSYEGAVVLDGARLGTVRLAARPTAVGGRPAYEVVEWQDREAGEGRVVSETRLLLGEDLAILSGERTHLSPSGNSRSRFERRADGMHLVHEEAGRVVYSGPVLARPDSTLGTVAALLLLAASPLPAEGTTWILPVFDPRFARVPKAGSGATPTTDADVTLEVGPQRPAGRTVVVRSGLGYESVLELDAEGRLVSARGTLPRLHWVPPADAPPPPDWFDRIEGVPQSAHQAFARFGRGYHLPREDLLLASFDWPRMLERGIADGTWAKDASMQAFQKAWVDEFVAQSKHRTEGDCDDLLVQIFMTMGLREEPDGSVLFETLPVYGGHRYRLAPVDGEWLVVAVD